MLKAVFRMKNSFLLAIIVLGIVSYKKVCLTYAESGRYGIVVESSFCQDLNDKRCFFIADDQFLNKQKFLFEILRNIYQPLEFEEYIPFSKAWIEDASKYKVNG